MEDDFARVKVGRHESREHLHGRDKHRAYYVCDVPENLPYQGCWKGLKQIGVAISETMRSGKSRDDVRYFGRPDPAGDGPPTSWPEPRRGTAVRATAALLARDGE